MDSHRKASGILLDRNLSQRLQHISAFFWIGFIFLCPAAGEAISMIVTHASFIASAQHSFVTFNKIWMPFLLTFLIGWSFWIISSTQFLWFTRFYPQVIAHQFSVWQAVFLSTCALIVTILSLLFAFLTLSPVVYAIFTHTPVVVY